MATPLASRDAASFELQELVTPTPRLPDGMRVADEPLGKGSNNKALAVTVGAQ